jgi:hypothetical protein
MMSPNITLVAIGGVVVIVLHAIGARVRGFKLKYSLNRNVCQDSDATQDE